MFYYQFRQVATGPRFLLVWRARVTAPEAQAQILTWLIPKSCSFDECAYNGGLRRGFCILEHGTDEV